jgi:hypothetical protein
MKLTRAVAVVLLAFLFGGSSAEVAVQTHRALQHRRAPEPGAAGDLVAIEVRGEDGEVVARPRLIATPGKVAHLVLRDPLHPDRIRLALRVEATREATGEISLDYSITIPAEELACSGRLAATPGVEHALDLGNGTLTATLLTLPVPSAAYEAYLEAERMARRVATRPT